MVAANSEQIRQHLGYELQWMLRAVVRFEHVTSEARATESRGESPADSDVVALQDSALLHARNLIEFAKASSDPDEDNVEWALTDILGTHRRKVPASLRTFLDNWVTQIATQSTAAEWPNDIEGNRIANNDDERLSKVTALVLKLLRPKHRTTTLETPAGKAYVEVLDRAREYFEQRTPETFDALARVGDATSAKKTGKKRSSKRPSST